MDAADMFPALQETFHRSSLKHATPRTDSVDGSPSSREVLYLKPADRSDSRGLSPKHQKPHIVIDAGQGSAEVVSEQKGLPGGSASSESQQQLPDSSGTGFSRGHHFNPTLDVILYMENMGQRWLKARPKPPP